ncbi:hypothetical protein L2Y94_13280 [Luteibacter aegosomatis]|uniref:hypothetical protein n=1 Tax=Luteibacter aegosomatis TaxID=2911537 RepID=UPI001FFBFAE5|nr:hypothetical protein [Luteibacter aegosomatis]UPG84313.1 hypothetical protein L2Y94_13280 [Luteibacter aegosomatis]
MVDLELGTNQRIVCAIGVLVLESQGLEQLLKFIVPMTDAGDPSIAGILDRASALASKPLGLLSSRFVDACVGDTDSLMALIKQVVSERNEVVHHFGHRFGPLLASGHHAEVLDELRARNRRARELRHLLQPIVLAVMEALRDGVYANTSEYQEMSELCMSLRDRWAEQ